MASLVFLGAFIPLIGALVSGLVAVVVALLAKGIVYALLTLGLLVVINQIEAHLLQPLVMGRAVSIHPLGVVLAITTGGVLAGIVGALLAVPTVAFLNNAMQVLLAPTQQRQMPSPRAPPWRRHCVLRPVPCSARFCMPRAAAQQLRLQSPI